MHPKLYKVQIIVIKMQHDWIRRYDLSTLGSAEVQEMQTYTLKFPHINTFCRSKRRHQSSKRSETIEGLKANWTNILLLPLICRKMEKANEVTLFRRDNTNKKFLQQSVETYLEKRRHRSIGIQITIHIPTRDTFMSSRAERFTLFIPQEHCV